MSLLRAVGVLVLALVVQAGLARAWPEVHRFVDTLLVPVVLYGLAGSQRSAMLVGCGAGLLRDAWFETVFGVNGFKRTLIGWALGAVASRLDLNHQVGRFAAGVAVSIADTLLDAGLRLLVDQHPLIRGPADIPIHALTTALLVTLSGSILDRVKENRRRRPGFRAGLA